MIYANDPDNDLPDDIIELIEERDETIQRLELELAAAKQEIERVTALHKGLMRNADERFDGLYKENETLSAELAQCRAALSEIVLSFESMRSAEPRESSRWHCQLTAACDAARALAQKE